jgi:uncharacterized protein YggT (Ycf19 family)
MLMLARMVRLITMLVVGFIVAGILLHVFGANSSNAIVSFVYDVCRPLVSLFKSLFNLKDAKAQIAVNWGIAAVVYGAVGMLLARLLAGAGLAARGGFGRRRRRTGVV